MSDPQPKAVWVFPEEPKRRGGRIAAVVLLVVLALIALGVVALFLIPRGEGPAVPDPTATSATAGPTPTPSAPPLPSPVATTPPPPADPDIAAFREQVGFRVTTATQGLDLIASAQDPQGTVSKLLGDAQRLADTPPPASIADDWRAALQDYTTALNGLAANPADGVALENARSAVSVLSTLLNP